MTLVKSTGNKKVNLDFNKEFISIFSDKIRSSDIQFINQTLKDLHESDVANLIENLSNETRTKLLEIEEFNIDPDIFIELNESIQSEVLQLLSINSLIKIIKRLESDNAIKILENFEFTILKFSNFLKFRISQICHFQNLQFSKKQTFTFSQFMKIQ